MSGQGPSYRFADYFVICGLDVASGLEPDTLSGKREKQEGKSISLIWFDLFYEGLNNK